MAAGSSHQRKVPGQAAHGAQYITIRAHVRHVGVQAAFISAKYVDRRYMGPKTRRLPQATAQSMLWDSVQAGDVHGAVHACVGGADLNAPFQTDAAAHLAEDAEVRCHKLSSRDSGARGQQLGDAPPAAALRGDFSIVHCACQVSS